MQLDILSSTLTRLRGRMLLLYGERLGSDFIAQTLAWIVLRGIPLHVIDAGNIFPGNEIARLITFHRQDPNLVFQRFTLGRAVTCDQVVECIARSTVTLARGGCVYYLAMLDIFYDENITHDQAKQLLGQAL